MEMTRRPARRLLTWTLIGAAVIGAVALWPYGNDPAAGPQIPESWHDKPAPTVDGASDTAAWTSPGGGESLVTGTIERPDGDDLAGDVEIALGELAGGAPIELRSLDAGEGHAAAGWVELPDGPAIAQAWIPQRDHVQVTTAAAATPARARELLEDALDLAPLD